MNQIIKDSKCAKCKSTNCIPAPDRDGFTCCIFCGSALNSTMDIIDISKEKVHARSLK